MSPLASQPLMQLGSPESHLPIQEAKKNKAFLLTAQTFRTRWAFEVQGAPLKDVLLFDLKISSKARCPRLIFVLSFHLGNMKLRDVK